MTETKVQAVSKRCAVGKIDLKGKFVYIDDALEQLLNEKRENLFGRDLKEFLTPASDEIVNQIISVRNHYETFYEATTLEVTNSSNQTFNLRAVFSLNFASGNPVNFLVIFDPVPLGDSIPTGSEKSVDSSGSISEFLNLKSINQFIAYQPVLYKKSLAEHSVLYEFLGEDLVILNQESDKNFETEELSQLYFDIAAVGAQYSLLDKENVENALENYKYSPNEYILGFTLENRRLLLRLIYPDDYDANKIESSLRELYDLISILEIAGKPDADSADFIPDVKFTIGFLDSFNIAAFLTDIKGDVIGYNPSLLQIVDENCTGGSYTKVIENMTDKKSSSILDKTVEYMNSGSEKGKGENLHFVFNNEKGSYADLYVIPFSDDGGDLSACFVIIPHMRLKDVEKQIFQ